MEEKVRLDPHEHVENAHLEPGNPVMECRFILDCWHGMQDLVHTVASLASEGQTNFDERSLRVAWMGEAVDCVKNMPAVNSRN